MKVCGAYLTRPCTLWILMKMFITHSVTTLKAWLRLHADVHMFVNAPVFHSSATALPFQDGWHVAVAGGLAGLSSIIEDPSRRLTLSLIVAARSLGAILSIMVSRKQIPQVNHFDSMTYIACSVIITYCVATMPYLLPQGYVNSLLKWTRAYTKDIFATLYQRKGDAFISCQEVGLHKYGCGYHAFWDFVRSWPEFAKLYLLIYLLPVLLLKRKMISERWV